MKAAALERMVRVKELGALLGWSAQRIYRLVHHEKSAQRIPHVVIGKEIHFRPSEVQAWLDAKATRAETAAPPADRKRRRSHAEECAALGIPEDHEFASY